MNTMDIMAEENELRILGEAELDGVFGGETAEEYELRAAVATMNFLLGVIGNIVNAQGQSLMNAARKA